MDFLVKKEQPIGLEDENDNDPSVMASCLDFKVAALKKKKKKKQKKMCFDHHELTDDRSSQILSMFRKYLYSKTQNDVVGKTNMEESEAIKMKHAARVMPRQASLLEQKLLPGIRKEEMQSEFDGKSSAAQLTIFYAGTINVYNNVPAHKAQAIMLLAGESSTSKPASVELPAKMEPNGISSSVNLTSVCKLQADLPIARKLSLQHFLEKRRCRIISKSPYSSPATPRAEENSEETKPRADGDDSNADHGSISLSPFPSRLGYFFPVSANKDL